MIKWPLFFRDQAHRDLTHAIVKIQPCPCCGQADCLILNGTLAGNNPHGQGNEKIIRGQRILCSNRGRRTGCGRSFSIYLAHILPGFSVDTILVAAFFKSCLLRPGAHAAWQAGSRLFSLSSAYRFWKKLDTGQTHLRHRLCRQVSPPDCTHPEPRQQLVQHLFAAFAPEEDPIAAYQSGFQVPFWR